MSSVATLAVVCATVRAALGLWGLMRPSHCHGHSPIWGRERVLVSRLAACCCEILGSNDGMGDSRSGGAVGSCASAWC
jgi:hypothetical protein